MSRTQDGGAIHARPTNERAQPTKTRRSPKACARHPRTPTTREQRGTEPCPTAKPGKTFRQKAELNQYRTLGWCPWRESNPHSLRNTILSRARLPVPPHPLAASYSEPRAPRQWQVWRATQRVCVQTGQSRALTKQGCIRRRLSAGPPPRAGRGRRRRSARRPWWRGRATGAGCRGRTAPASSR